MPTPSQLLERARTKAAVSMHDAQYEAEQAARLVREATDVLDAGGWRHDELDKAVAALRNASEMLKRAQDAMLFHASDKGVDDDV
jgi:hypothetical protein